MAQPFATERELPGFSVPTAGLITADLMILNQSVAGQSLGYKVRLTIFSGADFRAPHINRAAIYQDKDAGVAMHRRLTEALRLLGIPARVVARLDEGPMIEQYINGAEAEVAEEREGLTRVIPPARGAPPQV